MEIQNGWGEANRRHCLLGNETGRHVHGGFMDCFLSSPIISGSGQTLTVYFGSSDGSLYSLDGLTGSVKWKFKTGGSIHTSPTLYKGVIYAGSWDAYLYAIDATTGKENGKENW